MAAFSTAQTGSLEMELILSIVQEELVRSAKLRPTVLDYSAQAGKGVKQINIPRYDSHFSSPTAQTDAGAVNQQTVDFATDDLALSDWRTIPYTVGDRVSTQSMVDLEAELAASAGRAMGNYLDDKIIEQLKLASSAAPDHIQQLSGTDQDSNANQAITIADIAKARRLLNEQNVSNEDRFLLVSPKQEFEMLNIENFISAEKYGAREALLEGEIGRVFGFRVMVHNGLSDNDVIAYQKGAVAIAVQQDMRFEAQRQVQKGQTDYAFHMLAGYQVLEEGRKQVYFNATGT